MSGFPDDWAVSAEQVRWLDQLPPIERHAVVDSVHHLRASHLEAADSVEKLLESTLEHSDGGDPVTDYLTSLALLADSLRASAKGNFELANELIESAARYRPA